MSKSVKVDKSKELYWEDIGVKDQKMKVLVCWFKEFVFAMWTVERGPFWIFNK